MGGDRAARPESQETAQRSVTSEVSAAEKAISPGKGASGIMVVCAVRYEPVSIAILLLFAKEGLIDQFQPIILEFS